MNFVKCIVMLQNSDEPSAVSGGLPNVMVEVLGKSSLQRMMESLTASGIGDVTLIADERLAGAELAEQAAGANVVPVEAERIWRAAEQNFITSSESATHILLLCANTYLELNWEEIVQHHRRHSNRVTSIVTGEMYQPLDTYLVSSSRRNDAAFILRSAMKQSRTNCVPYLVNREGDEYVNLLQHEYDLRRLASDGLTNNCKMRPAGAEIRPGVWVGTGSRIDKMARLVAPVFIGRRVRVCPGAVITRGTAIEHHAFIGTKTVVENGTVLPYTHLGPGLDVSHSVVGERHIFHLQRNFCTAIHDPKLVDSVPHNASFRTLASAVRLLSFLPTSVWRGLKGKKKSPAAEAETSVSYSQIFDSAKKEPAASTHVPAELAVMRRYGNQ